MSELDIGNPLRDAGGVVCRLEPEPGSSWTFIKVSSERWQPGFRIAHQNRPNHALLLVRAGRGRVVIDGQDLPLAPGSCCVLGPGHPHDLRQEAGETMAVWRLTCIGSAVAPLLRRHLGAESGVWPYPDAAADAAAAMLRAAQHGGPLLQDILRLHYRSLLLYCEQQRRGGAERSFVQRARQALRLAFATRDPVRQAAAACGCSPEHFARSYGAAAGESPRATVERVRLQEAQDLLLETSLSLEQVALRIGYADGFAFSKAFKRWCGVPPSSWRQAQ